MKTLHRSTYRLRARPKLSTFTALAAVATFVLVGCTTAADPLDEPESTTQQQAFPTVYEQQIDWQECGSDNGYRDGLEEYLTGKGAHVTGIRCAYVTVPLNWDDPGDERTIDLSVLHIPSTGGSPVGTLLSNPGGPGASGNELAIGLTASPEFAPVYKQYDLLGFDPRGIARSTPVDCGSESEIFELQLALCAKDVPLSLSMGSAQVARDMELLRYLVGDTKLNYAGFSYGTVIGASYATLFPEHVGRIMLDSAWPSDWSSPLGTYQQQEAIVRATNELIAGCATEYDVQLCPIGEEGALIELMESLDDEPLVSTDGTLVDGSMISGYLTSALYSLPQGRHNALDVTGRALNGEPEAIDQLVEAMRGGGSKVDLSGMIVRCLSAPRDANLVGLFDYISEHGLPKALGGPEVTDDSIRQFMDVTCSGLPDSGEDYLQFSNQGSEPILVFGVTGDHATPYEGAKQMVRELGNAQLVTLEGNGHIASYQSRSTCADDIATDFLLNGKLPAKGTVCTDD